MFILCHTFECFQSVIIALVASASDTVRIVYGEQRYFIFVCGTIFISEICPPHSSDIAPPVCTVGLICCYPLKCYSVIHLFLKPVPFHNTHPLTKFSYYFLFCPLFFYVYSYYARGLGCQLQFILIFRLRLTFPRKNEHTVNLVKSVVEIPSRNGSSGQIP